MISRGADNTDIQIPLMSMSVIMYPLIMMSDDTFDR